ncbi:MAG: cupredoxin domain-containing protein [Candidatus Limnocylindrales bacterium]
MIETLQAAWANIIDWLSQVLLPDWEDVRNWIPAIVLGLVALSLAALAMAWVRNADGNRIRRIEPLREGHPPPGVHLPGPSKWPFLIPAGAVFLFASLVFHAGRAPQPVVDPATGQIITRAAPGLEGLINLPFLVVGLGLVMAGIAGWYLDAGREWRRAEEPSWVPSTMPALPAPAPEVLPPGVHLPGPSPWPFLAPLGLGMLFFGLVINAWFIAGGLAMALVAAVGWYRDAGREWRGAEAGHPPPARPVAKSLPGSLLGLYGFIAAATVALVLIPNFIAFVNPQGGGGPAASLSPNISITAQSVLGFDTQSLTVPANTPLTVAFDNPDSGVQHNFAIFTGSDLKTALFEGQKITGPGKTTYQVPALPKGTYHFVCEVHPQTMFGTITSQ